MTIGFLALAALALGGCDDDDNNQVTTTSTTPLTDAQAMTVLVTANQGEIMEAQIALTRATNPAVKAFAQTMITDHTAALQREMALASQLGLSTTASSSTSTMLQQQAAAESQQLQSVSTSSFDLTYMCMQIRDHAEVLQIIDTQLARSNLSAQVRDEVALVRASVQMHFDLANQVTANPGSDGGTSGSTAENGSADAGVSSATTNAATAACAQFGGTSPSGTTSGGTTTGGTSGGTTGHP
jgi:putative membrane protein